MNQALEVSIPLQWKLSKSRVRSWAVKCPPLIMHATLSIEQWLCKIVDCRRYWTNADVTFWRSTSGNTSPEHGYYGACLDFLATLGEDKAMMCTWAQNVSNIRCVVLLDVPPVILAMFLKTSSSHSQTGSPSSCFDGLLHASEGSFSYFYEVEEML